jgi:hypothetical protein
LDPKPLKRSDLAMSRLEGSSSGMRWKPWNKADEVVDRTGVRVSLRRGQEGNSQAIAHADKVTAPGTLVAGDAHEIKQSLLCS